MILIPETQLQTFKALQGGSWSGPFCMFTSAITPALRAAVSGLKRDDVFLFDLVGSEPGLLSLLRESVLASWGTAAAPTGAILCSLDPVTKQQAKGLKKLPPYTLEHSDTDGARHIVIGAGIATNPLFRTFLTNLTPKTPDSEMAVVFDVIRTHLVPK